MKYLKKYNENQEQQDPEFAIAKIKGRYPEDMAQDMLNDEINQWKPDDKDPEFYSTS